MAMKRSLIALTVAVAAVLVAYWLKPGYGEVSPLTYEFSKALYGACQTQSEQRLSKVHGLLESEVGSKLPRQERKWLEAIIEQASSGQWERATKQARRMLEDQVSYEG